VKLTIHAEPAAFERAAGGFLAEREAENNLFFGLIATLLERPDAYGSAPYLATVVDGGGQVALAALQTPPHNLIVSAAVDPGALGALVADLRARGGAVPGVLAPSATAQAFAELWWVASGQAAVAVRGERIYELTSVVAPRAVPGRMVRGAAADRELLVDWMERFAAEALGEGDRGRAERNVDLRLTSRSASLYLWIDGEPVCMAGCGGPTPTGIRVGPVYTPAGLRRRGYASACVAALSQSLLDSGRERCFLFTDLDNPTSNSIYQAIGYRAVCDMARIDFGAG
jgi:uncharacterized protein